MNTRISVSACAIAALAGTASASVSGVSLSFSHTSNDNGTWSNNIAALPGAVVYVRVEATIPTSFYGFAFARYNITSSNAGGWDVGGNDQIDLTPGKGSPTDGRYAGFDFGGMTQQVFEGAGSLRIDAKGDNNNNPNAGIACVQNTPGGLGTNFNTSVNAVPIFKFAVVLSSNPAAGREVTLAILNEQVNTLRGYETSGSNVGTVISNPVGDSGTITVIPAPGVIAGACITRFCLTEARFGACTAHVWLRPAL
jgi:hypothetical protein